MTQPAGHGGSGRPARGPLRLTFQGGDAAPEPADAPFAIERATALGHELRNLLDGSIRCLGLAKRSASLLPAASEESTRVMRYLETASLAMERMADLVNAAMRGSASVFGSADLTPSAPITLHEAIRHAVDVVTPEAQERGVRFEVKMDTVAAQAPVGPLYSVVLNALRNSLEAMPGAEGGNVTVEAQWMPDTAAAKDGIRYILLTVSDDGRGLPAAPGDHAFDIGYTTKPGHGGLGLALAREIVRETGGSIELVARADRAPGPRQGAVLRVLYPLIERKSSLG